MRLGPFGWSLLLWTLFAAGLSVLLFFGGGGHPPPMVLIPFVWIAWAIVAAVALAVRWIVRRLR